MYPTKWQTAILEAAREGGPVRISELARRLDVSGETVRRHVRALVEAGTLTRSHGAVALAERRREPPFDRRMRERAEAKRAIGRAAAALVRDGQSLMIDTGSTTAYVAEALAARAGLTVATNSLEIARRLVGRDGNRVYLAGGELRADLAAAVGPEALAFLQQFRADLAIVSIAAIDEAGSLMDFDLDEARIARVMLERSARRMVVADRTKFGRRAPVRVCGADEVSAVVTDAPPPAALARWLHEAGVELVSAVADAERPAGSGGPAPPGLERQPAEGVEAALEQHVE